jgi:hypothetical protein
VRFHIANQCRSLHSVLRGPELESQIKWSNDVAGNGLYLDGAGPAQLVQLGQTLAAWSQEIVAMWRFTHNNGITEGFHNFQNYRLRVKVLCS